MWPENEINQLKATNLRDSFSKFFLYGRFPCELLLPWEHQEFQISNITKLWVRFIFGVNKVLNLSESEFTDPQETLTG